MWQYTSSSLESNWGNDIYDFVILCEWVPKMKCRLISVWITADPEHLTLVIKLCVSHINKVAFLWLRSSFCGFTFIWQKSELSQGSLTSPQLHPWSESMKTGGSFVFISNRPLFRVCDSPLYGKEMPALPASIKVVFLCQFQQKSHMSVLDCEGKCQVLMLCEVQRVELKGVWVRCDFPCRWHDKTPLIIYQDVRVRVERETAATSINM